MGELRLLYTYLSKGLYFLFPSTQEDRRETLVGDGEQQPTFTWHPPPPCHWQQSAGAEQLHSLFHTRRAPGPGLGCPDSSLWWLGQRSRNNRGRGGRRTSPGRGRRNRRNHRSGRTWRKSTAGEWCCTEDTAQQPRKAPRRRPRSPPGPELAPAAQNREPRASKIPSHWETP